MRGRTRARRARRLAVATAIGLILAACTPVASTWSPAAVSVVVDSTVPTSWHAPMTTSLEDAWSVDVSRTVTTSTANLPSGQNLSCPDQVNSVNRENLTGGAAGALAVTVTCTYAADPERIWSADVTFDSDFTWSTAPVPPAGAYDLQSVATHEFGHLLGWNRGDYSADGAHHLGTGSLCSGVGTAQRTMCPAVSPGTSHLRSPEPEDVRPLQAAYP